MNHASKNWNPTISLEWLLLSIIEKIEPIIHTYIKEDSSKFRNLEVLFIKLASLTKEHEVLDKDLLSISIPKVTFNSIEKEAKVDWKSGVGYGNDGKKAWDINSFVKEQEIKNIELTNILIDINKNIVEEAHEVIFASMFLQFLFNKINGLTLLELEKNKQVYCEVLSAIEKIIKFIKKKYK